MPNPLAGDQRPLADILARIGSHKELKERSEKKNYAQRLSNELAVLFADRLRKRYPKARITPQKDGRDQEFRMGGPLDAKKTDVAVWDDRAGLILGISIKTITSRDDKTGRYTKNAVRNDMELRDEADKMHRRQPYAFLVGVMFLPLDSTWDGVEDHSSFAHIVFTLRKRTGRDAPDALRYDLFEQVAVALFTDDGHVGFFPVEQAPPHNQPPAPSRLLTLDEFVDSIEGQVTERHMGLNAEKRYAPDDPQWSPPGES